MQEFFSILQQSQYFTPAFWISHTAPLVWPIGLGFFSVSPADNSQTRSCVLIGSEKEMPELLLAPLQPHRLLSQEGVLDTSHLSKKSLAQTCTISVLVVYKTLDPGLEASSLPSLKKASRFQDMNWVLLSSKESKI